MNPIVGWTLALAGIVAGTTIYGWQGLVLALTIVAFWLLLQFSQVMRVMRGASSSPVGHVDSAVMLHAKLHRGMRMLDVVKLTRSLGRQDGHERGDERFTWSDEAGSHVIATFVGGRLRSWQLERPASGAQPDAVDEKNTAREGP
jgi:uncharacterized protein (DUF58 family)